jgi:long-chain acyl-CoA synthetase
LSLSSLHEKLAAHPDRQMQFLYLDGSYVARSYRDVHADVIQLMSELRACGLGAGDLVGLLGPNSYEWVIADLALLGLRCISVALPAQTRPRPEDVPALAERYQLSALLITRAVPPGTSLPAMAAILEDRPLRLRKVQGDGGTRPPISQGVFSIAFSSGTSGTTKGLLMSEDGVVNTIQTSGTAWNISAADNMLIVMPFSSFQQRYLMYLAIWHGFDATVVAPERMFQRLKMLKPTIILGPPSFFEVAYNRMKAAGRRDKLSYYGAAILSAVAPGKVSRGARARLGRRWTAMYGPRARLMLTGSAPVPPRVVKAFQRVGAPLFEVYGSTEVGWIAFNLPGKQRIGTAGRPVSGVDVTIADDGEVVVRTRCPQAVGYIFDGVETQPSVYLPDGRIATGDLGRFERSGFLRLVGRKKNVIITRSGVKINPEELEKEIEKGCRVTRAMVATPGSGGQLACVAWLDEWTSAQRMAEVKSYVAGSNAKREPSRRIAKVVFRPDTELTVESGLLTRNLKINRNAVMKEIFPDSARAVK